MSWDGLYKGVVLSAGDPQGLGRVRLQVPQVSGTAATGWAPAAQTGGGLPSVGQQVWVLYQGGDASYPVYIPPIAPVVIPPIPPFPISPIVTFQQSEPNYAASGINNGIAFTSAQWAPITFTVPSTGNAKVSIGASVSNTTSSGATGWAWWMASGGYSLNNSTQTSVSCAGTRVHASRSFMLTGMPVGASVTITPWYEFSSTGSGTQYVKGGMLLVEPMAV